MDMSYCAIEPLLCFRKALIIYPAKAQRRGGAGKEKKEGFKDFPFGVASLGDEETFSSRGTGFAAGAV